MADEIKFSRSSTAANLSKFFRTRQKTQMQQRAPVSSAAPMDFAELLLAVLKPEPKSLAALMKATEISFSPLAETLERLQSYGLVQAIDADGTKKFELTDEGRKAAKEV